MSEPVCDQCQRAPTLARADAVVLVIQQDERGEWATCAWCWIGRVKQPKRETR